MPRSPTSHLPERPPGPPGAGTSRLPPAVDARATPGYVGTATVPAPAPSTTEELSRRMARADAGFLCPPPLPPAEDATGEPSAAVGAAGIDPASQSAGTLMRRLACSIAQWRRQLPEHVQPAVMAILHGGAQVDVDCLAQEGYNGIRIIGRIGGSPCLVLAHQSTVQLLCYVQPVAPPAQPRRKIGFVIDGEESQA